MPPNPQKSLRPPSHQGNKVPKASQACKGQSLHTLEGLQQIQTHLWAQTNLRLTCSEPTQINRKLHTGTKTQPKYLKPPRQQSLKGSKASKAGARPISKASTPPQKRDQKNLKPPTPAQPTRHPSVRSLQSLQGFKANTDPKPPCLQKASRWCFRRSPFTPPHLPPLAPGHHWRELVLRSTNRDLEEPWAKQKS